MKKHKMKFLMDTDWLFQGILDAEQKEYVLLSYFQKLNQKLEEMKVYPMFTELSLHLGNIQTLLTQKQLLYTDKKFSSTDEEITFKDLKTKDIPPLTEQEYFEFQKILHYSQPKIMDYFQIAKALWTLAYDSIEQVNFSAETATLVKNQILQNAAMAMLAQANQSQTGLLKLVS